MNNPIEDPRFRIHSYTIHRGGSYRLSGAKSLFRGNRRPQGSQQRLGFRIVRNVS